MITANEAANLGLLSHQNSIAKGWWTVGADGKALFETRNFHEISFLAITELAEAFEVYRDRKPLALARIENGKPEGFPIEMADFVIRVLETMQAYGCKIEELFEMTFALVSRYQYLGERNIPLFDSLKWPVYETNVGETMMGITRIVSQAVEAFILLEKSSEGVTKAEEKNLTVSMCLALAVIYAYKVADLHAFDLTSAVRQKMEYNSTRPIRHGNKLA
jgi:hypothetical protein